MKLPYVKAERSAPDKYRLIESVRFTWTNVPKWVRRMVGKPFNSLSGSMNTARPGSLLLTIFVGYHFAVSVAPSFRRALPGACLHDWIYENAAQIAAAWGCDRRDVLRLADYWFLAQMSASQFLLKRTYFAGVRIFGYAFNSMFKSPADN